MLEARYADGGVRIKFPGTTVALDSRGAAVISVREGAPVPEALRAVGEPIGAAGRHWVVRVPAGRDALELSLEWAAHPDVAGAIPDLILPTAPRASFEDPDVGGQWYLEALGMLELFDHGLGDPEIRIGVIDSAIDVGHPDLSGAVLAPLDLVDGDDDPTPVPGEYCTGEGCIDEHGTAVTGIIGARANNAVGIVGLCPECTVVPVRMLGANLLSNNIAAFEHMIEQDVAVINNSWGFADVVAVPNALEEVINRAARQSRGGLGAVVVFAAGNDSRTVQDHEMQALDRVVCVSAVDSYHLPTNFTNSGRAVDVSAFAATVSLAPGGGLTTDFGGTSAAAPVVSGIVGWFLSLAPDLEAAEVRDLLRETAYKTSQVSFVDGHHPVYGYGEIDPAALLAALDPDPEPEPPEDPRGCGCSGVAPSGPGWALAVPLLLAWRRRR